MRASYLRILMYDEVSEEYDGGKTKYEPVKIIVDNKVAI